MADLSKVKIGESVYTLKDAAGRTLITAADNKIDAEIERATGAESGLENRIEALEGRGRYLSGWDVATGTPTDDPQVPSTVTELTYTYEYKAGDYFIVSNVPDTGTKYMPDGTEATATRTSTSDPWVWTYGKKTTTDAITVNDNYIYSTSTWTLFHTPTKEVVWGSIGGTLANQTDLSNALSLKEDKSNLKDLAYANTATGTVVGQTITGVKATGSLTAEITGDLGATSTAASLTYSDFTPSGTINGSAISGGSINVTVKDAATATAVTDLEFENYTPSGTIAAKATGGTSSVVATASLAADDSGIAITGSVSAPAITVTAGTEKTFATGLTGGSVAAFDTSKFHGGSKAADTFTAGTLPTKAADTFTAGSFTKGTAVTAATEGITAHMASGSEIAGDVDAETLIFAPAATDSVMDHDATFVAPTFTEGTFSQGTLPSFTEGTFTAASMDEGIFTANTLQGVSTGTVHDTPSAALAEAPTFTGDKFRVATTSDTVLKDVEFTGTAAAVKLSGAKYLKQEIDAKTFTPVAATLTFAGTTVTNTIVSGVNYDKATKGTLAATASLPEGGLSVGNIEVSAKTVTVSPTTAE